MMDNKDVKELFVSWKKQREIVNQVRNKVVGGHVQSILSNAWGGK